METLLSERHVRPESSSARASTFSEQSSQTPALRSDNVEAAPLPSGEFAGLLTPNAMSFIAALTRTFSTRRLAVLQKRVTVQSRLNSGSLPAYPPETEKIRKGNWKIAPIPHDLEERKVEITGPAGDTKMVINALNSGANVFMADFEDAQSPTWENVLRGQWNLRHAVRKSIAYANAEGKSYSLNADTAVLMVRPRGWHLTEKHVLVDGHPVSASLFDFGLYFFHNAAELLSRGTGPYFYLPKLESRLEARLWNDVFRFAEEYMSIPCGTIKATVLIETILAAFEMDEILYELREHSAGLNCGRWDYIFSFIKKFHRHPRFLLPDRSQITMDKGFLDAYVRRLVDVCHRRGAHAMGGMAAQIPINNDPAANAAAIAKVRADKEREVRAGHDGTWVAHPGLVATAREAFASVSAKNQIDTYPSSTEVPAEDLLATVAGDITETGIRTNIDVAVQYIEAWLRGTGAVPLYNLMEDAATAEISRAQLWQWIRLSATTTDGAAVTAERFQSCLWEELSHIRERVGAERFASGAFDRAAAILTSLVLNEEFEDFLTIPAYGQLS